MDSAFHITLPSVALVNETARVFDDENSVAEQALTAVFTYYPRNDDHSGVLLKVAALNQLYATRIYAIRDVAAHIVEHSRVIDNGMAKGSPEIVDLIASVRLSSSGKRFSFWSFASKYCSWHNRDSFPIWDSRVDRYLRALRKSPPPGVFLNRRGDLWNQYSEYVALMTRFKAAYGLSAFSFKTIDKFLYTYGAEGANTPTRESVNSVSA